MLCFVVVTQSFIMNSHEVFIHIHQGCFAGTGAIVRLPQCQRSKLDGYGKISQCITTTMHSKAKTVCIFLGIYCIEPIVHIDTDQHIPAPIGEHLLYTLYIPILWEAPFMKWNSMIERFFEPLSSESFSRQNLMLRLEVKNHYEGRYT